MRFSGGRCGCRDASCRRANNEAVLCNAVITKEVQTYTRATQCFSAYYASAQARQHYYGLRSVLALTRCHWVLRFLARSRRLQSDVDNCTSQT